MKRVAAEEEERAPRSPSRRRPEPSAAEDATPVPEPRVTVARVERVIHQLGAAEQSLRVTTREIGLDLHAEEERLRLVARQTEGWEAQRVTGLAEAAVEAIATFVGLVAEARAIVDDLGPALDAAEAHVTRAREHASTVHMLESIDLYNADVEKARRVWLHLRERTEKYETWIPTSKVSAGRVARAAARVSREYAVLGLTRRLRALSTDLKNLRSAPIPFESRTAVTLARAEGLVKTALPVPAIVWPASDDPFAGPELEEP